MKLLYYKTVTAKSNVLFPLFAEHNSQYIQVKFIYDISKQQMGKW